MPRSSRPRKAYRPKAAPASNLTVITDRVASGLRTAFSTLETSIRLSLPAGAVHPDELKMLEDAFNAFGVAMVHRRETSQGREFLFEMDENKDALEDFLKAKTAFHSYASRRKSTGIKAAKGDEMNAIFRGIDVVFPFIDESFVRCPRLMCKELAHGQTLRGNFGETNAEKTASA